MIDAINTFNEAILIFLGLGTLYFLVMRERSFMGPHWLTAVATWSLSFLAVILVVTGR